MHVSLGTHFIGPLLNGYSLIWDVIYKNIALSLITKTFISKDGLHGKIIDMFESLLYFKENTD